MFTPSEFVMTRINQENNLKAFQEAEKYRMLRRAGLLQPGGLVRTARRSAGSLGRVMVALGQRLVQIEASCSQASHVPVSLESA